MWLMVSARPYWMRAINDHHTVQNKRANLARYGTVLPYTCPSHDKSTDYATVITNQKFFSPKYNAGYTIFKISKSNIHCSALQNNIKRKANQISFLKFPSLRASPNGRKGQDSFRN